LCGEFPGGAQQPEENSAEQMGLCDHAGRGAGPTGERPQERRQDRDRLAGEGLLARLPSTARLFDARNSSYSGGRLQVGEAAEGCVEGQNYR